MNVGRRGSGSVALIVLVLGLVGIAVVAVSWKLGHSGSDGSEQLRPATAVVVEPKPCGGPAGQGDRVTVTVDGARKEARLDGCGHMKGQQLPVSVPVAAGRDFVVRPASPETSPSGHGVEQRMNWVLLTLAGIAGGGYALLLRGRAG